MILIKVFCDKVQERKSQGENDKIYYKQLASFIKYGGEIKEQIWIPIQDSSKIYPLGYYLVSEDSFYKDKFSGLAVSNYSDSLVLLPISSGIAAFFNNDLIQDCIRNDMALRKLILDLVAGKKAA